MNHISTYDYRNKTLIIHDVLGIGNYFHLFD